MLKLLVRLTAFGITVFLAALTGIFLSAVEESFPWDTDRTASLDFSASTLTKTEAISSLGALADREDLRIGKVAADPENFLNAFTIYVFGDAAPDARETLDLFRPTMSGELRSAEDMGDISLRGTYVLSGSDSAVSALEAWAQTSGVDINIQQKTFVVMMMYALMNTGAWLALLTCVILVVSLTVSWYVLRSRARTLKALAGAPAARIVAEDLISLVRVCALPVLIGTIGSLVVVVISGRSPHLWAFFSAEATFILATLCALVITALVVSALTWPRIASIAARKPPEGSFRLMSEILKMATVMIVALALPAGMAAIVTSMDLTGQGAKWEALDGQVTVRVGTQTIEQFDAHMPDMDQLVQAAAEESGITFSYAINADTGDLAHFDGIALVNPAYVAALSPVLGLTPQGDNPFGPVGTPVPVEALPESTRSSLIASYDIWNRGGQGGNTIDEYFRFFTVDGGNTFPVLTSRPGEMVELRNPLIVVIDAPEDAFNVSFLASTLSSGNLMFSDAEWVHTAVETGPLADQVLSIDRVSDSGLYSSQQSNTTAALRSLSIGLVILALVASITISAWIFGLSRQRASFVKRTSGWRWMRILAARMAWEAAVVSVAAFTVWGSLLATDARDAWWVLLVIPLYLGLSGIIHRAAFVSLFAAQLARRS